MIENVERAVGQHQILPGVDIVEYPPPDLLLVLYIDMGVHHNDHFGEHHLPHPPDSLHNLFRLLRVRLLYGNHRAVMKNAGQRQINIDDLGNHLLQERQENALRRFGDITVFHRRPAHDGRRVNRIFAMRNTGNVKHRIVVGQRVVTGMIAERPFPAALVDVDVPLQHDLARRRDLDVDGYALRQFYGFMAQKPGEHHLIDVARQRRRRRISQHGIGSDGDRRFKARHPLRLGGAIVLRPVLVNVPVHSRRPRVIFLQAVHTDVTLIRLGIFRKDQRQRHERATVLWPAL